MIVAFHRSANSDRLDTNDFQIKVKGDDGVLSHCVTTSGTGMYECERAMKGHYIEV